jgi:hypothetical protein
VIVALAGRRIDAPGADQARFPLENVAIVRARIEAALRRQPVAWLVCAAACGADLIALDVAHALGIPSRIILPRPVPDFRAHSVIDRPGNWGDLFDRLVADAARRGALVVREFHGHTTTAYFGTNAAILNAATDLANQGDHERTALVVWDGVPRGDDDVTFAFLHEARRRGFRIVDIDTLRTGTS